MSATQATFRSSEQGFQVEAYERIDYRLDYVDDVFSTDQPYLANCYEAHRRCLLVIDATVHSLHQQAIEDYFAHHEIDLTVFPITIGEVDKSLPTLERIVDAFSAFGLLRTEPVLVVGGGLITDVVGFACASYRRGSNYIRVPTTLIGQIDASVSIKVAVNHGKSKNRLGGYHASQRVILDPGFLRTLPIDQIRNGMAEIVKIATVANRGIFEALESHAESLLHSRFGRLAAGPELAEVSRNVMHDAIATMLRLEVPNLHELDLDRVIAYGHTWSPTLELLPEPPMFHGHAISIDMAFSATLAAERGLISSADRDRILALFSGIGLAVDSPYFTAEVLRKATASILQTRDGLLRAALPHPIGECVFVSDVTVAELVRVLDVHRDLCRRLPRQGAGVDMYTGGQPSSDTESLTVELSA